jgi:hypothetical protein
MFAFAAIALVSIVIFSLSITPVVSGDGRCAIDLRDFGRLLAANAVFMLSGAMSMSL